MKDYERTKLYRDLVLIHGVDNADSEYRNIQKMKRNKLWQI